MMGGLGGHRCGARVERSLKMLVHDAVPAINFYFPARIWGLGRAVSTAVHQLLHKNC